MDERLYEFPLTAYLFRGGPSAANLIRPNEVAAFVDDGRIKGLGHLGARPKTVTLDSPVLVPFSGSMSAAYHLPTDIAHDVWKHIYEHNPSVASWLLKESSPLFEVLRPYAFEPYIALVIERAARMSIENDRTVDAVALFASALVENNPASLVDSARHVLEWLHQQEVRNTSTNATGSAVKEVLALDHGAGIHDLARSGLGFAVALNSVDKEFIEAVLKDASGIAEKTCNESLVDTRHLLAALLSPQSRTPIAPYLDGLDIDVTALRHSLFDFILTTHPNDKRLAWREILDVPYGLDVENRTSPDYWTVNDSLGYRVYAKALSAPIRNGTTQPPLTIGIQAPWGQGKTTLMRMIQKQLDPGGLARETKESTHDNAREPATIRAQHRQVLKWIKRAAEKNQPMLKLGGRDIPTIWFNPLYYRETSQIWAGMAHAILHQLADRLDPLAREEFWLRLQLARINAAAVRRDVQRFLLSHAAPIGIGVGVVATAVLHKSAADFVVDAGIGGAAAGMAWLQKLFAIIDRKFDRYVTEPNYQSELGLLHLVDHDLDRALQLLVGDKPIVIFIDDLDRCDPQTVYQVILAINQFVSLPRRNAYFFLGMDMEMVAAALEKAQADPAAAAGAPVAIRRSFGWRFMEKFIQLPFVIPHLDAPLAKRFATEHLRGSSTTADETRVEAVIQEIASVQHAEDLGVLAQRSLAHEHDPQVRAQLQEACSERATELMRDSQTEEIERIVDIAVDDLDLNPRTMKRYFSLVRVLRNIQLANGTVSKPDLDRQIVLRAAHLQLNWPQFVQWLVMHPRMLSRKATWDATVTEVESIAGEATNYVEWSTKIKELMREIVPPFLQDVALYLYLKKLAGEPPGLKAMYDARMF